MSKLLWDQTGERSYEHGLDRGVLYLPNGSAVPWNGLTGLEEQGGEATTPLYIDGLKFLDLPKMDEYSANLKAITYPDEFMEIEGLASVAQGLYVDDQNPKPFGLSYRTGVGNDVEGPNYGYKIHVAYNLLAVPDDTSFASTSPQNRFSEFGWDVSSVPVRIQGYYPTSHLFIDTRFVNRFLVRELEDILYGTDDQEPRLPPMTELVSYVSDWNLITITDHGDGTWTAEGPDELITMLDETTFQIDEVNAVFLSNPVDGYNISTTKS